VIALLNYLRRGARIAHTRLAHAYAGFLWETPKLGLDTFSVAAIFGPAIDLVSILRGYLLGRVHGR
jgi:hypothetical protein